MFGVPEPKEKRYLKPSQPLKVIFFFFTAIPYCIFYYFYSKIFTTLWQKLCWIWGMQRWMGWSQWVPSQNAQKSLHHIGFHSMQGKQRVLRGYIAWGPFPLLTPHPPFVSEVELKLNLEGMGLREPREIFQQRAASLWTQGEKDKAIEAAEKNQVWVKKSVIKTTPWRASLRWEKRGAENGAWASQRHSGGVGGSWGLPLLL